MVSQDLPSWDFGVEAEHLALLQQEEQDLVEESQDFLATVLQKGPAFQPADYTREVLIVPKLEYHPQDTGASTSIVPPPGAPFQAPPLNKIIRSMPEIPMFSPSCNNFTENRDALTLLQSWIARKRQDDPTITGRTAAMEIVNTFSGLAHTWWHYASAAAKEAILGGSDPVSLLMLALRVQFVGTSVDHDLNHYRDLFMSNQLGNLAKLDEYFCQMQQWIIMGHAYSDVAFIRRYVNSLPGSVPQAVHKYYRDSIDN